MATLVALGGGTGVNMAAAQVGNGVATNIVERRPDATHRSALLKITTTVGATPTCTYFIEGSPDATNWFPLPSQDLTTPGPPPAATSATFAITSATTTWKLLPVDQPWIFVRITFSVNTNVTNTVDIFCA